jgi:hypothetical protein
MKILNMIITDSGDGSNGIQWTDDEAVLARMEELADEGDSSFSSGDGLQVTEFRFSDDFDLQGWMDWNGITLTTLEELDE